MPLGDSSLTLLVSETSLGYSDQAERSRALGKEWKALVWLLNRVALIPFRRVKDTHYAGASHSFSRSAESEPHRDLGGHELFALLQ